MARNNEENQIINSSQSELLFRESILKLYQPSISLNNITEDDFYKHTLQFFNKLYRIIKQNEKAQDIDNAECPFNIAGNQPAIVNAVTTYALRESTIFSKYELNFVKEWFLDLRFIFIIAHIEKLCGSYAYYFTPCFLLPKFDDDRHQLNILSNSCIRICAIFQPVTYGNFLEKKSEFDFFNVLLPPEVRASYQAAVEKNLNHVDSILKAIQDKSTNTAENQQTLDKLLSNEEGQEIDYLFNSNQFNQQKKQELKTFFLNNKHYFYRSHCFIRDLIINCLQDASLRAAELIIDILDMDKVSADSAEAGENGWAMCPLITIIYYQFFVTAGEAYADNRSIFHDFKNEELVYFFKVLLTMLDALIYSNYQSNVKETLINDIFKGVSPVVISNCLKAYAQTTRIRYVYQCLLGLVSSCQTLDSCAEKLADKFASEFVEFNKLDKICIELKPSGADISEAYFNAMREKEELRIKFIQSCSISQIADNASTFSNLQQYRLAISPYKDAYDQACSSDLSKEQLEAEKNKFLEQEQQLLRQLGSASLLKILYEEELLIVEQRYSSTTDLSLKEVEIHELKRRFNYDQIRSQTATSSLPRIRHADELEVSDGLIMCLATHCDEKFKEQAQLNLHGYENSRYQTDHCRAAVSMLPKAVAKSRRWKMARYVGYACLIATGLIAVAAATAATFGLIHMAWLAPLVGILFKAGNGAAILGVTGAIFNDQSRRQRIASGFRKVAAGLKYVFTLGCCGRQDTVNSSFEEDFVPVTARLRTISDGSGQQQTHTDGRLSAPIAPVSSEAAQPTEQQRPRSRSASSVLTGAHSAAIFAHSNQEAAYDGGDAQQQPRSPLRRTASMI